MHLLEQIDKLHSASGAATQQLPPLRAAAHRHLPAPTLRLLQCFESMQDTVGKPIQCKAAIAWEANKPLEVPGSGAGHGQPPPSAAA